MQATEQHAEVAVRDSRVFFALSDVTRRQLLDRLNDRDGQRLSELAAHHPISRQAVSKHLEVLEEAGLVIVRRSGRETLLFLNRMPLRRVQRRWLDKYTSLQVRVDCC